MSVLEQLLFAIVGVTMLAASLALSDPHLSLAAVLKAGVNHYSLQSCADP
jgi:hypothetical protein